MDPFSYLSVLISIILALGITRLLGGFAAVPEPSTVAVSVLLFCIIALQSGPPLARLKGAQSKSVIRRSANVSGAIVGRVLN